MPEGPNARIVRRLYEEGYDRGEESVYAELYHPHFRHHSKTLHDVGQGGEAERQSMRRFRAAMPDARFEILQLLEDGDHVAARLHITGTPVQAFDDQIGPDSGAFDVHALALFRLEGGLLREEWFFVDGGRPPS